MQARTANPLLFWAPAIMLSLLAHAALVMTIQSGTAPDPVPMTEEIHTRIDMSSLDVPSQRAEAQQAEGELAKAGEASGERLGVRDVPTSRARPVAPAGQTVAALTATAPVTQAATAQQAPVQAASPDGARLAAASPDIPSLTSAATPATPAVLAAVPSDVAAAVPAPRGDALATVEPEAATLAASLAEAPVLAAATAAPSAIAAASPPTDTLTVTESRGPIALAVLPPSATMAAATLPAQTLSGARANAADLAPVSADTARLTIVAAEGARVAPARPTALPAVARVAQATAVLATVSAMPAVRARPPPATPMVSVAAPAQSLTTARVKTQQVASLRAAPEPVATLDSASPQVSAPAALAVPEATELASSATSQLAGRVTPTSAASASVVASAALAWSGSANTVLDEQSLAAIQSFMQPGDIAGSAAHAGSVRDGIGAALAQFPCSRLQAAFLPETGGLEIRGHVPTPEMKTAVVGMLEQSVGGAIPVGGSVLVLPNPQCGVLDAVERLGVPQSRDQIDDPLTIGEEAQARIERHEEGNPLTLSLKGAEYDAYIYIDYYDADGNVIHLMPNERRTDNRYGANREFKMGDEESGLRLTVAPPFGQDIAVVLAATTPLYEGALPLIERADEYLPRLHARVDALREADPDFRGEWAYLFVMTGPVGAFAER